MNPIRALPWKLLAVVLSLAMLASMAFGSVAMAADGQPPGAVDEIGTGVFVEVVTEEGGVLVEVVTEATGADALAPTPAYLADTGPPDPAAAPRNTLTTLYVTLAVALVAAAIAFRRSRAKRGWSEPQTCDTHLECGYRLRSTGHASQLAPTGA